MMGGGMMGSFGGFGGFGWIGMIINLIVSFGFLALLALGVVWIVRQFSAGDSSRGNPLISQPRSSTSTETPEQILKIRLARGEIDEAEYERLHTKLAG
jgi:uncharacterized membrane protein